MAPKLSSDDLPPVYNSLPVTELLSAEVPPIQHLQRITSQLAEVNVFLAREDLASPLAFGGNKLRKLEYVLGRHLANEDRAPATLLLTEGSIQSNHCRQTAGAAAKLGLKCVLLLAPLAESRGPEYEKAGNVQLDHLLGAEVRVLGSSSERASAAEAIKSEMEAKGEVVAWIPAGASKDERGGVGYSRWIFELLCQQRRMSDQLGSGGFQHIFVSCSSGSTLGGMVAGLKFAEKLGFVPPKTINIHGIDVSAREVIFQRENVLTIAQRTATILGIGSEDPYFPSLEDIEIDGRWNAGAYGRCDTTTSDAIKLMARNEAVFLDPVYTGKGFAGVLGNIKEGSMKGNILFVHTGGHPALSVYGGIEHD
ncbi:tryptophan synthase beta subunit-like PLP-dependent enzyme [Xylaria arbuscula]|nr:tryptophan synthase beta subunit-like PLP-dependent enzyme [Xylaria arbuscula]